MKKKTADEFHRISFVVFLWEKTIMTKKIKKTMIISFIFLFGLMVALCVGAFSPALTPAKADTTIIDTDTLYFEEYSSYKWKDTISFTGLSKNITLTAGPNDCLLGPNKTMDVEGLDTFQEIIINPTEQKIYCKGQNSSFEDTTVTLYDGTSWANASYQTMWFPRPVGDSNYTAPITDSASVECFYGHYLYDAPIHLLSSSRCSTVKIVSQRQKIVTENI